MKKFVSIIAILLMLSLAACSNQDTPSAADNPSNTQTESNTMLDAGVWPVNEYTEGLPVPSGTVGWAMLDQGKRCLIILFLRFVLLLFFQHPLPRRLNIFSSCGYSPA